MSSEETTVVETPNPRRAAKACRRCHRKKLRCFGGNPCVSCKKAHQSCDFGDEGELPNGATPDRGDSSARFAKLERLVETILSRMNTAQGDPPMLAGSSSSIGSALQPQGIDPHSTAGYNHHGHFRALSDQQIPSATTQHAVLHPSPGPALGEEQLHPFMTPASARADLHNPYQQDSSGMTDTMTRTIQWASPSVMPVQAVSTLRTRVRLQDSPENRLALASQAGDRHSGPLRPLAFQPAHWENVDRTRPPSPAQASRELKEHFWSPSALDVRPGLETDPLTQNTIDLGTAEALIQVYLRYCYASLPVFEFGRPEFERFEELRSMGPFVFTTVLAVAAHFATRPESPFTAELPTISTEASLSIRRLAYAHYASSIFRRHQNLRDLQAALLLAGWGLHAGSEGPEAWMTTGHCGRLAFRLDLHRLETVSPDLSGDGQASGELRKLVGRWKAWLSWFCFDTQLELGFGRPPTMEVDPMEASFMGLVLRLPNIFDISSSLYLIALTQLTKLSRNMSRWLQKCTEHHGREFTGNFANLQQWNREIDQWAQSWTWIGSPHYLRLGRFIRSLKLQCEHSRLSLNAIALSTSFANLQDPFQPEYLRLAAMSALEIVQIYIDSTTSDRQMVFSLDYIYLLVGHALVFMIRLYVSTEPIPIERAVIQHYLQTATSLLIESDATTLGQGYHIGKTCTDLSRVAHVPLAQIPENIAAETSPLPDWLVSSEMGHDPAVFGDLLAGDPLDFNFLLGLSGLGPQES